MCDYRVIEVSEEISFDLKPFQPHEQAVLLGYFFFRRKGLNTAMRPASILLDHVQANASGPPAIRIRLPASKLCGMAGRIIASDCCLAYFIESYVLGELPWFF